MQPNPTWSNKVPRYICTNKMSTKEPISFIKKKSQMPANKMIFQGGRRFTAIPKPTDVAPHNWIQYTVNTTW